MLVCQGVGDLFQHQVVKHEARHFEVIDCEGSTAEEFHNGRGPAEPPDSWMEVLFAAEPYAAGAVFASIAEADKVGPARDQLF
jgi:hypothetical protein